MKNLTRVIGGAGAGIIALIAGLLVIKPLFTVFSEISKTLPIPVGLMVGFFLLIIAGAIFQIVAGR